MRKGQKSESERLLQVLQDILITQLGRAGIPQLQIREIVGVDVHRVNRIVRYLKIKKG